mmetsp:Transcript_6126/g.9573  ORF Transcript_6126/g.9573 Transcript_6126/m.9573 type:complete len:215 (-) Transcript_6126:1950-2594(-)
MSCNAKSSFEPHTELREARIVAKDACILYIDVQNATLDERGIFYDPSEYFTENIPAFLHNLAQLQVVTRAKRIENVFVTIESLTRDGRDRSLDYRISGFNIPKDSFDGKVYKAIEPKGDEIVIRKTSCDVFVSTNIDYVLRNMGIKQIVVVGMLTDQCVSSTVRHACDKGYLVTLVSDACFTRSQERQDFAIRELKGFCRTRTTKELMEELNSL